MYVGECGEGRDESELLHCVKRRRPGSAVSVTYSTIRGAGRRSDRAEEGGPAQHFPASWGRRPMADPHVRRAPVLYYI